VKVVVGDPAFDVDIVRVLLDGVDAEVVAGRPPWGGRDVAALLVGPDYPVGAGDFDRLPGLLVVASCSVGFDHVDVGAAVERGVWVCNVPDYCVEEMADSSLALLLALLRGIVELDRSVRAGAWDHRAAGPLRRLAGTTLGILGFGRIGRALARRALALGFDVAAVDPYVPAAEVEAAGVEPLSLDELLSRSNAVSLHLPLEPETRGLLGPRELGLLPRGAVLVNTARAGLVDFEAVLAALERGQLGGAAFDVLPIEPPTNERPAPQAERLVVTPHAAWYSPATEEEVYRRPVLAVREALEGRRPADALAGPGVRP
jgi:D-3-phosphoglycerate dehydrogenase